MNLSSQNINPVIGLNLRPRGDSRTSSSTTTSADISPNHVNHSSRKHATKILKYFNKLRRKGQLCDVVLNVQNKKFYCHRGVLAACSPYFHAMFTEDSLGDDQEEIFISDMEGDAIEAVLDYMYTSNIKIDESNVHALFPVANLMQLDAILDICTHYLKDQLTISNCLSVYSYADNHSCSDLYQTTLAYIREHFTEIIEQGEFLILSINQLACILASGDLNIPNEEFVYQAVMNWVKYDIQERRDQFHQALQYVGLSFLNPQYLVNIVSQDPLIRYNENCRDLVDRAKNILLLPDRRDGMYTIPRSPKPSRRQESTRSTGNAINTKASTYIIGGWSYGKADNTVERCYTSCSDWKIVSKMNKRRYGVGAAVLDNNIFVVGGHDGQAYLNTVEKFNPKTKLWSLDVATTRSCRTSHGVAVLNDCIYAIGGQDGVSSLNLVERYDPHRNEWFSVVPMRARRLGVATVVLGGCIYAVGGFDGTGILSTVERLDLRENRWVTVSPMNKRRKHHGAVVMNGVLHVVGGKDDNKELKSGERYDIRNNTWIPIASMTTSRCGTALTVLDGQLAAIGGFDGVDYLKSIEIFDKELDKWKFISNMNHPRLGAGIAILED